MLADVSAKEEQDVTFPWCVALQRRHAELVRRVDGGDQQVLRRQPRINIWPHVALQGRAKAVGRPTPPPDHTAAELTAHPLMP